MTTVSTATVQPLTAEDLRLLDAYWRAANYLSVGQVYLLDNPLLREPLRPEHIKPRLLGHFGTTPGLNLIYVHLNRAIRQRDLDAIYVTGPGHGGPALVANAYLEGTYTERLPGRLGGRVGAQGALPTVLLPGRDPEPRRARGAGLDPRGRRARVRARPRVRRRLRQPRPGRRLRRGRRRGRDRAARGQLALEQVPECKDRRRRPADPAPERLQDREPDGARPDPGGRAPRALPRVRLGAAAGRRRRAGAGASGLRGSARPVARPDCGDPARRARRGRDGEAGLADDRAPDAEGLDGPEGRRRSSDRRQLAISPGPDDRRP